MKIKLFLLFVLLASVCNAQLQDLAKLANGKLIYSSLLYDANDNVYGYIYVYQRDENKTTLKMEYVFLDKNLNKVSNNTFTSYTYEDYATGEYYDCTLMGENIILNKFYSYMPFLNNGEMLPLVSAFQMINLKENTVSKEFKFEDGKFTELPSDWRKLRKDNRKEITKNSVVAFDNSSHSGFFVFQQNTSDKDYLEKDIKLFNENRELKWKYLYNPVGKPSQYLTFHFLYVKDNTIYGLQAKRNTSYASEYKIVALDFETGKKKYEYLLEDLKSQYSHTLNVKEINGQLVLVGNYSAFNKKKEFELTENLGFYKIILDKNGKEIEKKHVKWSDFSAKLDIDEKGEVEKIFLLKPTRFLFFNNGSISIITEKYKPERKGVFIPLPIIGNITSLATYSSEKTSDFVIFTMDSTFSLNTINTIKKDLTKYNSSDFLFSQYIDNESGAVFFYENIVKGDKSKDKSVVLGITRIKNGAIIEEKIPIFSKEKYSIQPFPAKEGYIMLREFNEKEKYNQIRLEKVNL